MQQDNFLWNLPFQRTHGELEYKPTNDYMFKKLFVTNEAALKAFLSSLLHIPITDINEIEIKNPEILPEQIHDKTCILDISLVLNNILRINLEMQVTPQSSWPDRSVIYLYRMYDNLPAGKDYGELLPAKQIGILDFDLFPEEPEFFAHYKMINVKNHKIYNDKVEVCVLNSNQINLATEEDIASGIHLWARFFKAGTWEDLNMLAQENAIFADCAQTIHNMLQDDAQRLYMQSRIDGQLILQEKIRERDEAVAKLDEAVNQLADKQLENERLSELLAANGISIDGTNI